MVREEIWQHKDSLETQHLLHYNSYVEPSESEKDKLIEWVDNDLTKFTFFDDGAVSIRHNTMTFRCGTDFWILKGNTGPLVTFTNELTKHYEYVGYVAAYEKVEISKEPDKFKFNLSIIEADERLNEDWPSAKKSISKLEKVIQEYLAIMRLPQTPENIYSMVGCQRIFEKIIYEEIDNYVLNETFKKLYSQIPELFFNKENGISEALAGFDWSKLEKTGRDCEKLCYKAWEWVENVQKKIKDKVENYGAGTYSTTITENDKTLLIIMPVEDCEVDDVDKASVFLIAPKEYSVGMEYR